MRNRRCRCRVVESESVLRAIQTLQAESRSAELGSQRLTVDRMTLGEVLILREGAFEVLHFFCALAQVEPSRGRHLVSAGIGEFRIVLERCFDFMRPKMQLA